MNIISGISNKDFNFIIGSFASNLIGSTIVHEYSHMTAMRVLFSNVDPYISCDWKACYANWEGQPIIRDGLSITQETAMGIISSAGPIADITITALLSLVAWKMRHSNQKISLLFAANAVLTSTCTLEYCLSTLGSDWGDFASVESNLGVSHHIQAAMVSSVALGTTVMLTKLLFFSENPMKMSAKKNI